MGAKVRQIQGAWWVVTHHQGKRQHKRIGSTRADKRQAEEIAKKVNATIALGAFNISREDSFESPKLEARLRSWHQLYSATFKKSYAETARGLIENHLVPSIGDLELAAITQDILLAYISGKIDSGLSPATIHNSLSYYIIYIH